MRVIYKGVTPHNHKTYPFFVIGFIWLLVFSPSAFAQTTTSYGFISAQDVYENPDDHDLNLQYAKQEIRRGELLNAGSALERMLYDNPNWHSARLLYSAVLYRLDDQKAALRELTLLKGKELNAYQTTTYERYQVEFETPPARRYAAASSANSTVVSRGVTPSNAVYDASLSEAGAIARSVKSDVYFALRADDNAGNALTDEGFGFDKRGDVSAHLQGRINITEPISADGSVAIRAAIGGQVRRHETYSAADYDVADFQLGLMKKPSDAGRMSLDIDVRRVNISGEKYLSQIGPRATFTQRISDKNRATISLSVYNQDYHILRASSLEDERDGYKTRLQFGVQTLLNTEQTLTLAAGYDTKSAELKAFAYEGPHGFAEFTHNLVDDGYLKTQVRLRQINYHGSLDASQDRREDVRISARQSYGSPLSNIINAPSLENVGVEFALNYNQRFSNIDSNDYDNLGAEIRLNLNF